jgi:hypothetical protein
LLSVAAVIGGHRPPPAEAHWRLANPDPANLTASSAMLSDQPRPYFGFGRRHEGGDGMDFASA